MQAESVTPDDIILMLTGAVRVVQKYTGNDELQAQTLLTLLECLRRGEMPMGDLEKVSGTSQAAVSRNVARLGDGLRLGDKGPRLMEAYEDPAWRRRKLVRVTAQGRKLKEELSGVFLAHLDRVGRRKQP